MATRRQPLNLRGLMPGLFAATLLCAVALARFWRCGLAPPARAGNRSSSDSYLWHVVRFSFWQASLSALISVGPAIFLARALYRRRFPGRTLLLRLWRDDPDPAGAGGGVRYPQRLWPPGLAGLTISRARLAMGVSPYGLQGILLAHVFFNMPMATRLLLQALENIPGEQRQIAAQLGMRG
ncbi:thiamin ABC transporter transmembrane protein [Klebsiella pneumoniae]|uniref:Thiamin ABC transporter transmembrane protein n=1 Tax=Klebsiella pneumoniae TaxID=573 RepID=A0A377TKE8_KLEPN|nr:thiamin ABC transporter transmembrane protein [Klebsiella pneumoniae]